MTSKPKLNQPDVESTITSPIGESLNINFTIPSKQFEQVFEKDTNIEKRNLTLEEVKKEWEELGYKIYFNDEFVCFVNKIKTILIFKVHNAYSYTCYANDATKSYEYILLKEHQLLTKTFKALGLM